MQYKHSWINKSWFRFLSVLSIGCVVVGCKNYSVSLNDNVVYMPPPIFKDYAIADKQLFDCVQQTLFDGHITRAEDLTRLNCSNAGIQSLKGLETFFALKDINLAENQLRDIQTIGLLGRLETVKLNNNQIIDPSPLRNLLQLKQLDLQNNPDLDCRGARDLVIAHKENKATLALPIQCSADS